jgi:hypothetical protein
MLATSDADFAEGPRSRVLAGDIGSVSTDS